MSKANNILIPTILCGGAGSRLWPVSREQHPKPFIRMEDGESLLQKAFLRGASLPTVRDVITVTNREFFFKTEDEYREVHDQLDKSISTSFILEPFGRNTAPAIAAAALSSAETHGENAILLVLAADHLISDQPSFSEAVSEACALAEAGKVVTFGIKPTAAETGYGYIEADGHKVKRFVEKPSLDKAQKYLESGNYLWNSGMFCFSVKTMLREMNEHCPEILTRVKKCMEESRVSSGSDYRQTEITQEHFMDVPADSIDYAVMEKTRNAAVVACDLGWSDIGCWRALGDLTAPDDNNNRLRGDALMEDSRNCTVNSNDRVVGAVGVESLIIIDTPDALLVADKSRSQDVKQIYSELKTRGHDAHKLHRTVYRPWGTYTVLEEGLNFKIKRIEIKPAGIISLQMHHRRSEHWVVVSGTARVLNDSLELTLGVNESTYIPATHKHRLENIGEGTLVIIEVQSGEYLGEDDIVRFQDAYGRAS